MTIQDTIKGTIRAASGIAGASDGARAEPTLTLRPARKIRRLPVQKDWPLWAIIATQVGILVIIFALWQVAADRGWIDGFFWSKPSAIWQTLITFFTDGDAFTDIGFTFRSTIIGFLIDGRLHARAVVLVVAQLCRHRAALRHLF
jgi:NitT/TauT family transport system permease protein